MKTILEVQMTFNIFNSLFNKLEKMNQVTQIYLVWTINKMCKILLKKK